MPYWLRETTEVATTNDLKNGMTLNLDGELWTVLEFQHVKPGKGGAFVRTKLKNVVTGKIVDKTFNAGPRSSRQRRQVRWSISTRRRLLHLHGHRDLRPDLRSAGGRRQLNYLLESAIVTVAVNEGTPLYIELPASVELTIAETEPGLQGDRSTGGTKPATLETGAVIQVPLFVTTGDKVKVDTRTGEYLGRVN